jgi:tRNA(Ile)-lysidine synthase
MREVLLARIRETCRRERLISGGDRLVIGLSGGADSVTLAHLLPEVARGFGAEVVALAHLNHQLRPDADQDEAFCHTVAARLDLPLETGRADVRAEAARARTSLEDAGRTVRYAFLKDVARARGATSVAVAHTLNDQAETVLLRLCRGAGPTGLAGIYPRAGQVIRPLLDVRRLEVEAWLAAERLAYRDDPTNRDLSIPRNRIRHELLPYLARHAGEGILAVLARQAVIAREDADYLEHVATETTASLVLERDGRTVIPVASLLALPPALRRRVVRQALQRRAGGRFVGFDHVDAVLALAREAVESERANGPQDTAMGQANGSGVWKVIDCPGQRVQQIMGRLVFEAAVPDPGRAGRRRGRTRPGLEPAASRGRSWRSSGIGRGDA